MRKYLVAIIMAFAMLNTAWAAGLEDDRKAVEQVVDLEPSIQRYVYVMDRLNSSIEEFVIVQDCDYLPIITEMDQGDLVATVDEQVKLNLQVKVKHYSDNAVARKLALVPIGFEYLTKSEQQQHKNMEKYSIYAVEEQPVNAKNGPIIIDNNAGLENVSYFVNMLTQIKMVR